MAAAPGNAWARKLDTPELRQQAYQDYCEHIATGLSRDCWVFNHPDIDLTSETMERYIKDFGPEEFDLDKKRIACAKALKYWELAVHDSALGINKDASTASLQMIMRNKFGWDKRDHVVISGMTSIEDNFNALQTQISHMQSKA
jgi:hypothetical protein